MNDFPKVLVVDDGERSPDRAVSAELAEMGFASVTASYEAAEDVLEVIPTPSAILVQIPPKADSSRRQSLLSLADRLRGHKAAVGVPVVVVEAAGQQAGAYAVLQEQFSACALARPDRS
jgi:hypothetical protein